MYGTSSVFVVAAVPMAPEMGINEERAPFWLNRLFGSGRKRKASTSRDIGTSITEEQLYLESPPPSPGSPGWSGRLTRLPDLVTSCDLGPPAADGAVFIFPEEAPPTEPASAPAPSPELLERLAWPLPGAEIEEAAAAAAAEPSAAGPAAEVTEVGQRLRQCADNLRLSCDRPTPPGPPLPCSVEVAAACCLACVAASCVCYKLCK